VAISIPDLEQRAALGWRAPEEDRLGDWLLRAADGFTGRANSALAVGDPGRPLDRAAAAVRDWYQARGLPAMIAVPYPAGRPHAAPAGRFLAERGWSVRSGAATVMIAPAGQIAGTTGRVPDAPAGTQAGVDPEPDEAWLGLYHYRGQAGLPLVARQVLTSAPWQAFASLRDTGHTIAIGRVAAAAGWAGLTAIEVAPEHRRRGLATVITAILAARAVAHGARHLYLQVEDGNEAARVLYRRLGFTAHHGYHYRVAPHRAAGGRLSRLSGADALGTDHCGQKGGTGRCTPPFRW
jgi:N-acetylglutamate synthase